MCRSRARRGVVALVLAAFLLAGCSGSDDAAPEDDTVPDVVTTDGAETDPTDERVPTTATTVAPTTVDPVATSAAEPEPGVASPEAWTGGRGAVPAGGL